MEYVRFLYEGERINEKDTPGLFHMDDDDEINVVIE